VGLALLGTVFANRLASEIGPQSVAAGVPQQLVDQFQQSSQGHATNLIQVGVDLGAQLLAQVPAQYQALVKPIIPNLITGIYQAFSVAIGEVFLIGAGMTVAAFVATLFIRELPLRGHASGASGAEAALGADAFGEVSDDGAAGADEPAAFVADH
jgi:hypothetical protein